MTETRATYKTKSLPFIQTSERLKIAVLTYWTDDTPAALTDIPLDSPEWYAWLELGRSFRVTYNHAGHSVSFNVLAEKRGERLYWRGYKNIGGKLRKKYLGATVKLTQAKLNEAGRYFWDIAQARAAADPTAPYAEALADYEALVSQLLPHLPAHLARHARAEMGRIKDSVGNG
jgi:hypothetical protein